MAAGERPGVVERWARFGGGMSARGGCASLPVGCCPTLRMKAAKHQKATTSSSVSSRKGSARSDMLREGGGAVWGAARWGRKQRCLKVYALMRATKQRQSMPF